MSGIPPMRVPGGAPPRGPPPRGPPPRGPPPRGPGSGGPAVDPRALLQQAMMKSQAAASRPIGAIPGAQPLRVPAGAIPTAESPQSPSVLRTVGMPLPAVPLGTTHLHPAASTPAAHMSSIGSAQAQPIKAAEASPGLGEWQVRNTTGPSAGSSENGARVDQLEEKDLDVSVGAESAGEAGAGNVAGHSGSSIADQGLHGGSMVRSASSGERAGDATATGAVTVSSRQGGRHPHRSHGTAEAAAAAAASSSQAISYPQSGMGMGYDSPDGPATSEREGPLGMQASSDRYRGSQVDGIGAADLSSHRDAQDDDDAEDRTRDDRTAVVATDLEAAESPLDGDTEQSDEDWRTRERAKRDGSGVMQAIGEDDSGPLYRDGTFACLAPRDERPKLLLKIGLEPDELILAEGQSLRRCVQKGWLMKFSDDARWIKGWKRRYFRVVVHTSVELLNADAAGRGAQLPRMDEKVTAAWLLYYEDDTTGEPKETIDLHARAAEAPETGRFEGVADVFQVSHDRRRTYYLRPTVAEGDIANPAELMADRTRWVQTINAAVQSIDRLFVERFRRAA